MENSIKKGFDFDFLTKVHNLSEIRLIISQMEDTVSAYKKSEQAQEKRVKTAEYNILQLARFVIWVENIHNAAEIKKIHNFNLTMAAQKYIHQIESLTNENIKLKKMLENE